MKQLMTWVFLFTLASLACGMSAGTLPEAKVSTNVQAPSLGAAPTPIRAVTESPAFACGGLWVRYGAGIEYGVAGFALKGDTLYRTDAEPRSAADKGIWVQVIDRNGMTGWVNIRYLCGGE